MLWGKHFKIPSRLTPNKTKLVSEVCFFIQNYEDILVGVIKALKIDVNFFMQLP